MLSKHLSTEAMENFCVLSGNLQLQVKIVQNAFI